jgi:hypothetical protein
MILLILLLLGSVSLFGVGFLAPARLALAQEQVLGVLHGGIVDREERTFVDGCVRVEGLDAPQAVTRTIRLSRFGDGTSLMVIFDSRPTPTNVPCNN